MGTSSRACWKSWGQTCALQNPADVAGGGCALGNVSPSPLTATLRLGRSQVSTIYISCPAEASATLGIKLPFLVMIIKNLKKYFSFEVQVRQRALSPLLRAAPC